MGPQSLCCQHPYKLALQSFHKNFTFRAGSWFTASGNISFGGYIYVCMNLELGKLSIALFIFVSKITVIENKEMLKIMY